MFFSNFVPHKTCLCKNVMHCGNFFNLSLTAVMTAEQKISHKPPMPPSMKELFYIIAQMEKYVFSRNFSLVVVQLFRLYQETFHSTSLPTQPPFFESFNVVVNSNCFKERRFMIIAEISITLLLLSRSGTTTKRMKILFVSNYKAGITNEICYWN